MVQGSPESGEETAPLIHGNTPTVDPQEGVSSALHLCPDPVAVLVVSGREPGMLTRKFAVSTEILSASSPYFKVLFGSNFAEGQLVRQGGCPEIHLRDDDADAMGHIFEVLHLVHDFENERLKGTDIQKLSKHIDKYQCIAGTGLEDWVRKRLVDVREPLAFKELSTWLSIAHWCALLKGDRAYRMIIGFAAYKKSVMERRARQRQPEFAHQTPIFGKEAIISICCFDELANGIDVIQDEIYTKRFEITTALQNVGNRVRENLSHFIGMKYDLIQRAANTYMWRKCNQMCQETFARHEVCRTCCRLKEFDQHIVTVGAFMPTSSNRHLSIQDICEQMREAALRSQDSHATSCASDGDCGFHWNMQNMACQVRQITDRIQAGEVLAGFQPTPLPLEPDCYPSRQRNPYYRNLPG